MSDSPQKRRPQFGIGLLILLTTLLAVAAAAWGGLRRGGEDRAFFVIFTLIAPVLVLVLVSLWQHLSRRK
jgi:lipopolysaccharide export LptBFGC system permease protein LptF